MKPAPRLETGVGARWLVAGGTGLVGRRLVEALADATVTVLSRDARRATFVRDVRVVTRLDEIDAGEGVRRGRPPGR